MKNNKIQYSLLVLAITFSNTTYSANVIKTALLLSSAITAGLTDNNADKPASNRAELEIAMFGKRLPREQRYTSKRSPRDTWSKKQQGKRNNGRRPYSDRSHYKR